MSRVADILLVHAFRLKENLEKNTDNVRDFRKKVELVSHDPCRCILGSLRRITSDTRDLCRLTYRCREGHCLTK